MANRPRKTTPQSFEQEILNIDDAAAFLGVSVKTFSKVLREGDVPGRKVGREWKFSRQALIDWIGDARSRNFLDTNDDAAAPKPNRRATGKIRRASPRKTDGFSVDEL